MKRQNLLKSASIYAVGEILPKILSVLLLPVFTRYLLPEDYGVLAYVNSVIGFVFVFSLLSLNTFVLRHYFEYDDDDEDGRRRLIGGTFVFLVAWNLVLLGSGFLLGPLLLQAFDVQVPFWPYFALALGSNFFNMMSVLPLAVFRLLDRPGRYVWLAVSRSVLNYLVAYVLVVQLDWGVLGMFAAQIGVFGLYSLIYFAIVWRHGRFGWEPGLLRRGLAFSLPLLPGVLSHLVINMIDRLMLEAEVSLDRLGIYSIGYTLGFFSISVLIMGGYRAFEPAIFQVFGTDAFKETYRRIRSVFLPVVFMGGLGVALFGREFLFVLTTPRFYDAYRVVPVITAAACLRGASLLFTILLVAAKRTRIATTVVLLGALVNVGINLVLIPRLGIYGAACSSVASFAVILPAAWLVCERLGILRMRVELLRDLGVLALAAAIVWLLVYRLDLEPSWPVFGLKVAVAAAFGGLLVVTYRLRRYVSPGRG